MRTSPPLCPFPLIHRASRPNVKSPDFSRSRPEPSKPTIAWDCRTIASDLGEIVMTFPRSGNGWKHAVSCDLEAVEIISNHPSRMDRCSGRSLGVVVSGNCFPSALSPEDGYGRFVAELMTRIQAARSSVCPRVQSPPRAALLGHRAGSRGETAGGRVGDAMVEHLAVDLRTESLDVRGFSGVNLWRMKQPARAHSSPEFLSRAVRELAASGASGAPRQRAGQGHRSRRSSRYGTSGNSPVAFSNPCLILRPVVTPHATAVPKFIVAVGKPHLAAAASGQSPFRQDF